MNSEQNPSFSTRLLSVTFFSVLTTSSLLWFFVSITKLLSQIRLNDPVVAFDKGSMYMLGVGIGLLCLTIGGLMQGILGKVLTAKRESLFKRSLVISIVLIVTLPPLAQYLVDSNLRKKQYKICNEATYHWLLYSKYYYTDSQVSCENLVKGKEITKNSSGR